jgi:hypothetical protein
MRLPLLLALLAVPATSALAQTAPPPAGITQEQASTLPPDQLADMLLRQIGTGVTSVTRPHYGPGTERRVAGPPTELRLATAPHATMVVGLCAATLIEVSLEAPPFRLGDNPDRSRLRSQARQLRAAEVYKVVGELEPYAEVSEQRAAEEDRRCAEAGPVLPAYRNDYRRTPFFTYHGGNGPETALLVLQRAITGARTGSYRNIGCDAAAQFCRNPRRMLASLELADVLSLSASPIGLPGVRYRISASFLFPGASGERDYWTVVVEADLFNGDEMTDSVRNLGRTVLARALTGEVSVRETP